MADILIFQTYNAHVSLSIHSLTTILLFTTIITVHFTLRAIIIIIDAHQEESGGTTNLNNHSTYMDKN